MRFLIATLALTFFIHKTNAQVVSTISGGSIGDDKPPGVAVIDLAEGIAIYQGGIIIADKNHHRLRSFTPINVSTVAGNGSPGLIGENLNIFYSSPQPLNKMNHPTDVVTRDDGYGNFNDVYFVDKDNNKVRAIINGTLKTYAGTGYPGYSYYDEGASGPNANLNQPTGIALDAAGNLYIADRGNHRVRKVTPQGVITTIAGYGFAGTTPDGWAATSSGVNAPTKVAVDAAGNVYISCQGSQRIQKIKTDGTLWTICGDGTAGFSGDTGLATSARINNPSGLALDASGNLYFADSNNDRIRRIDPAGIITTVAGGGTGGLGDGGLATNAMLSKPMGLMFDPNGDLFISDTYNYRVRKVDATGIISTVLGTGSGSGSYDGNGYQSDAMYNKPEGITAMVTSPGFHLIVDSKNNKVYKTTPLLTRIAGNGTSAFAGDGGDGTQASLNDPAAALEDAAGNFFIADRGNNRIRKVDTGGTISTVAGNGTAGFNGDGSATGVSLSSPSAMAMDPAGRIIFSDASNNRIRRLDLSSNTITTLAGSSTAGFGGDTQPAVNATLNSPKGVVVDAAGNIFFADRLNNRIRQIDLSGNINTVVGGGASAADNILATTALINQPNGLTLDLDGNLFFTDATHRVRKVNKITQILTTVVGSGTQGYSGEAIPVLTANLNSPSGICVHNDGSILIADSGNDRIQSAQQTLSITIPPNQSYPYDGTPRPVSFSLSPSNGTVTVLYNFAGSWSASPPVWPGVYGVYIYSGPPAYGLVGSVTGSMKIEGIPTITLNSTTATVCPGQPASYGYSATTALPNQYKIVWSTAGVNAGFPGSSTYANLTNPIVVPTIPVKSGTYYASLLLKNSNTGYENFTYSISITIQEPSFPSQQIIIPDICSGITSTSFTFAANGSPDQYRIDWSGFANVPLTNLTSPTSINLTGLPALAAGAVIPVIYPGTLYVKKNAGCESLGIPLSVRIIPVPNLVVSPPAPAICPGSSIVITASGADNPGSYQWSPTTGLSSQYGQVITANPTSTTTYTLTAHHWTGCTNSIPVTVTVNNPIVTITPSAPRICIGSSVSLTASGASTYSWSPSTGLSATTGASVIANPTTTTTYTVVGTDAIGCTKTKTVTVTVKSLPSVNASPSAPAICQGSGTLLTASGAYSYSWSPATGLSATTGTSVTASPTSTTTYTLTGTDTTTCSNTKTVTVTVNSVPVVSLSPASASICQGASVALNASGATTYYWTPHPGLSTTNGPNTVASPQFTLTYTVSGTTNGCTDYKSVTVNVLPANATITASGSVCSYGSIVLSANASASYLWSTGETTQSINPYYNGNYSVTTTSASGCSANSQQYNVSYSTGGTITQSGELCTNGVVYLYAGDGYNYSWGTSVISVYGPGYYEVSYTTWEGCQVTAGTYVEQLNTNGMPCIAARTSADDKPDPTQISNYKFGVYPNPASEKILIVLSKPAEEECSVQFYDLLGRLSGEAVIETGIKEKTININHLEPGTYVVNIQDNKSWRQKTLIIRK